MVEEIKIENGTGLTSEQIMLVDGEEIEITVVDDRNIAFPQATNTITLLSPITNTGTVSSNTTYQVVNNNYNAARKQEGERVILAKKYTLITPS